ncbi:MAG: pyridoxal-phosphate dependent enzyme [Bacteroidota bacterium]
MRIDLDEHSRVWASFLAVCKQDLLYQSRIHLLQSFGTASQNVYLKREDESGFGTTGSKKRKIASLLAFLTKGGYQNIGIIGGPRSNHVVSLLQWVRESAMQPHLFLKASHSPALGGNALLLDLLAKEDEICWLENEAWPSALTIAEETLARLKGKYFVVPEGGFCEAAVPGLATLLMDIERNEAALGKAFDHICIDAGTGLTAAILIWLNAWRKRSSQIHVILTVGTPKSFTEVMKKAQMWLAPYLKGGALPSMPAYRVYRSATAAAYGSVNATIRKAVRRYAQSEGVLCDPIYTAKLLYSCEKLLEQSVLQGSTLIIHNGGGTGLMGFKF